VINTALQNAQSALNALISAPNTVEKIDQVSQKIADTFSNQRKVLICGNGGSACDAMHFAEEFTGRYRKNRKALPVISLTDASHITCVGNDFGFDAIFSRGVEAYGQEGDMFIGISTSGNSQNVINAVEAAKKQGLSVVCFLGKDGGKLAGQSDIEFIVPGETTDRIQELHMMILHILIEGVERILFPELY